MKNEFCVFYNNTKSLDKSGSKRGPHVKPFETSSKRSKRRKMKIARDSLPKDVLSHLVKQNMENKKNKCPIDEALALYIDMDLTEEKYLKMKRFTDKKSSKFYPYITISYWKNRNVTQMTSK